MMSAKIDQVYRVSEDIQKWKKKLSSVNNNASVHLTFLFDPDNYDKKAGNYNLLDHKLSN